jgi:hypothetical protein
LGFSWLFTLKFTGSWWDMLTNRSWWRWITLWYLLDDQLLKQLLQWEVYIVTAMMWWPVYRLTMISWLKDKMEELPWAL